MDKALREARAFFAGVLRGMDSPAYVYERRQYRYPHTSEVEAMRGDWRAVGRDIRQAMKRSDGKAAA